MVANSSASQIFTDQTERFLGAARANGKRGLITIENYDLPTLDLALREQRLPEVLALCAEQLTYYFHSTSTTRSTTQSAR